MPAHSLPGILLAAILSAALALGCERPAETPHAPEAVHPDTVWAGAEEALTPVGVPALAGEFAREARAELERLGEQPIHGLVLFQQAQAELHVVAEVGGLPRARHYLHVLQARSCGYLGAQPAYLAEVAALTVAEDGTGFVDTATRELAIEGPRAVVGRAVAITTADGEALACGVAGGGVH